MLTPQRSLWRRRIFESGSLQVIGYARPGKPFTASSDLVVSVVGRLRPDSVHEVLAAAIRSLRGSD